MNSKRSFLCAAAALILLIAADQLTKQLAVQYLYQNEPFEIIPGVFELHFLINKGAAFGIMQNHQYFFAAVTCAVLCVLVWVYGKTVSLPRFRPIRLLLILLMSGAVGNLLDRVRLGYVIDFFYFKLIDFPIFNVADCYVVVSVILLAVLILFVYKEEDLDELGRHLRPGGGKKS
ncbi:MAG: signal peptidase II [Lachnospiraceae bacterium]|nr:signal peptidase II [Lachnospiraceae bacterium]